MDSSSLLVNLVFALAAAFLGAVVAARLGRSVMLGDILTGLFFVSVGMLVSGDAGRPFLRRPESELELALEMTRHTLRPFGASALETLAIVQGLRERVEAETERRGDGMA